MMNSSLKTLLKLVASFETKFDKGNYPLPSESGGHTDAYWEGVVDGEVRLARIILEDFKD